MAQVVTRQGHGQVVMLSGVHTCRHCGATREQDAASALAWVCERDPDGREHWLCPACARRHVRDIEAKLPPEWWA